MDLAYLAGFFAQRLVFFVAQRLTIFICTASHHFYLHSVSFFIVSTTTYILFPVHMPSVRWSYHLEKIFHQNIGGAVLTVIFFIVLLTKKMNYDNEDGTYKV